MILIFKVFLGYCIDLSFGDPQRIIHPVQIIGKLIIYLEKYLYKFKNKKLNGTILNIIVLVITYLLTKYLSKNIFIEIYLIYTIFATKCLANEANKIFALLKSGDLEKSKKDLSYLLSRDTKNFNENDIIKSTVETISENIVDGVIAPMFYLLIGGVPLAMTYKAINTMDSMLGYKNNKYIKFGFFSAKVDDVVNFIPARITGLILIPLASLILKYNFKNSLKIFIRDRLKHSSPNSGHPEASVAGALGICFGGKTSYFGKIYNKAKIGDKLKEFELEDIKKTIKIMYLSSFLGLILFSILRYLIIKGW